MKIVTYEVEGRRKLGILNAGEQWVYPLECFGMDYRGYGRGRDGHEANRKSSC